MGLTMMCLLAGCQVGPEYQRPQTAASDGTYHWLPEQWQLAEPNDPNALNAWWREFNDPVIDDLVYKALRNNTDLLAAAASVDQAEALLAQAYGARLPEVSTSFNRNQQKMSFTFPTGRTSFIAKGYSLDLSISYLVDIFGKLRRAEQAAEYDFWAAENNRQALAHAIVAQVIQTRIEIATQQRLMKIAQANIESWTQSYESIESRYEGGLVSALDVYLARENLSNAQARKYQTEQALVLTRHALDVLCGQRPMTGGEIASTLGELPALTPVPAGLPVSLLDRRPDIRSTELRLAAATERVGISMGQLYPDLVLTATAGYTADDLESLINPASQVYAGIINATAPIFNGGQLKAGVKAAQAATRQAAAEYAGIVLNAMREVEDALVKQQMMTERIGFLQETLDASVKAENLAKDRYGQGLENILTLLETERGRRMAENDLAMAQGDLWKVRVELFLAIGGNWGIEEVNPQTESANIQSSEEYIK